MNNSSFPKGNYESWKFSVQVYLPKAINKIQTEVDPVIMSSLLALTGSSDNFSRHTANVENKGNNLQVALTYQVPSFQKTNVLQDDIDHDKSLILSYLKQLPGISIVDIKIDTSSGLVYVVVNIPIGWNA